MNWDVFYKEIRNSSENEGIIILPNNVDES